MERVDVVVIGAGQAGLSAAYHLQHRGFVPWRRAAAGDRTFVVFDAEEGPGGAWRHRWESLKMGTVNGIYELPDFPVPPADADASSRDVLPAYFADYEERFDLDVLRPVRVRSVERTTDPYFTIATDRGDWRTEYVINATGTWTRPYWPFYPGRETFRGRQLHVQD